MDSNRPRNSISHFKGTPTSLRIRGGSLTSFERPSVHEDASIMSSKESLELPRSIDKAIAMVERWWLVALICAVNLEVVWKGGLFKIISTTIRLTRFAFFVCRFVLGTVLLVWIHEKSKLAIHRSQRPPIRSALLSYTPFSVERYSA